MTGTPVYTTGTVLRMCFSYFGWVSVNPFCRTAMPAPRINMRKLKDALRLKFEGQQSHQQIATALGISKVCSTIPCAIAGRIAFRRLKTKR